MTSFGWYERDDTLFIAMEYLEQGDLQRHLSSAPEPLPEHEAGQITFQVLEGLSFMHESRFAHRDLKPGVCISFTIQFNLINVSAANLALEYSY